MPPSDAPSPGPWREDWDRRARRNLRLYVAAPYSRDDDTWREGIARDERYLLQLVPDDVRADGTCLDLGCGPGRLFGVLARRFARVVACDVSPEMAALARASLAAAPPEVADRVRVDLCDGTTLAAYGSAEFAAAFASSLFIHLDAPTTVGYLAELARVLEPGGVLAASFSGAHDPRPAPPGTGLGPIPPPAPGPDEIALMAGPTWDGHRWERAAVVRALEDAGFDDPALDDQSGTWVALARKPASGMRRSAP